MTLDVTEAHKREAQRLTPLLRMILIAAGASGGFIVDSPYRHGARILERRGFVRVELSDAGRPIAKTTARGARVLTVLQPDP